VCERVFEVRHKREVMLETYEADVPRVHRDMLLLLGDQAC